MENAKSIYSTSKEMDEFEEKVITLAAALSYNNKSCNGIIDIHSSIEAPNGDSIKIAGTIEPRLNKPRLTYDTKAKAIRLIQLKSKLDTCINFMIVGSLLFIACIYYVSKHFENYTQVMDIFLRNPFFRKLDLLVLMAIILVVIILFFIAALFSALYEKYKSYKKDLIAFVGSQICFCNSECNCREAFIMVMHQEYSIKIY